MTTPPRAIPTSTAQPALAAVETPAQGAAAMPVLAPAPVRELPPQAEAKPAAEPKPKPELKPLPQAVQIRPPAKAARPQRRHWGVAIAFVLMVLAPVAVAGWYLYTRASDQYASTLGFTVRSEDVSSATEMMGLGMLGSTLGVGGGGGGRDTDILYEFIRSQKMVASVDARLDLRGIYSRDFATDPLFGFDDRGTIEDLTTYWQRMVRVSYDANSGLMELRVLAFSPTDAQAIAEAIEDESSTMINALSTIARTDATRYAREDLDLAETRLREAREALTTFRMENQIVDLSADLQGQMGLLATLQTQQASALIEYDLLASTAREGDPRLEQASRRIDVIEARIAEERNKFGSGGQTLGGDNYANTVAEFERLTIEREFAEKTYLVAMSGYDAARAEADRKSLYLAAYITPTRAERAEFPQRELMLSLVFLFSFLLWSIGSLIYYALRDSR